MLISLKPKVTAQSLREFPGLCAIGRCGVGYDNVDLEACTEHGIAVFITPGGVVRPVAESIVLLVLALSHNLLRKDRLVRRGLWAESTRRLGREPRQRVVGTIGLGNIASEAIRLLRVFDVGRFLAFDPYVSPERAAQLGVEMVSLEELLRSVGLRAGQLPAHAADTRLAGQTSVRADETGCCAHQYGTRTDRRRGRADRSFAERQNRRRRTRCVREGTPQRQTHPWRRWRM